MYLVVISFLLFLVSLNWLYHYPNVDPNVRLSLVPWVFISKVSINTKLLLIAELLLKIFSLDWEVIPQTI